MHDISFFEGAEKLLEIWFSTEADRQDADLRKIPRDEIEKMLQSIKCRVLSFMRNRHTDAYVLSESSLFIDKSHLILKTCGTIPQLQVIVMIVRLAADYAGFDRVKDLFYSRKNFLRPDLQTIPHGRFEDEVDYLDDVFKNERSFIFGMDTGSPWYLYTLQHIVSSDYADQTLEIMMSGLSPKKAANFFNRGQKSLRQVLDFMDDFPNCQLDEHVFEPCGYSCNALMPEGHYFTVHVTPESSFSYASFESNSPESFDSIHKVLDTFNPSSAIVTMFANDKSSVWTQPLKRPVMLSHYDSVKTETADIKNYRFRYVHYRRLS